MWSNSNQIDIAPIYEEILYTFLHNNSLESDEKLEIRTLYNYMQNAFVIDNDHHNRLLKLAGCRKPPILRVDVKCAEAKYLRTTSLTGTGNYMINIYKTSSPIHVNTTQIQFDTNNPKWTEVFSIPIVKNIDNDRLIFEVYDCCCKKSDSSMESVSTRGLKSLIKELTQTGNKNKLVGQTSMALESIKYDGLDVWLNLEKNGKYNNRGMINVQVSFCAEKTRDVALEEYQCILHNLLLHELHVSRVADYWWDGKFSDPGEAILRAYRSRVHLSKLDVALSKWAAFTTVHVNHPLSFILFDSLLNTFSTSFDDIECDADMKYVWEGAARLLPSCLAQIHTQIANKNHDATLNVVLHILATLQVLSERSTGRNEVFTFSIFNALENAVIDGSNEWFDKQLDEQNISLITDSKNITKIKDFLHTVQVDLSQAMQLDGIFKEFTNLRFAETLFLVYDEKLGDILEKVLIDTDSDWHILCCDDDEGEATQEKNITVAQLQLYLTLKELLAVGAQITNNSKSFKLNQCQIWFSGALTQLLELEVENALIKIENAVDKDNFVPEHEGAKYSSSAIDAVGIFYQLKYVWEQLEWTDDIGSFMIIGKIIYDICRLCTFYANKIQSSLENLHLNHNHTQENFEVTQQWCLAINNIEFIRARISIFINEISIQNMVTRISNLHNTFEAERAVETFQNIMEYISDIKNSTILQSITQVIRHMSSAIRTNLTAVVKSENFESKSITDLFEYIDNTMTTLRNDLNQSNFGRTVELLWDELVSIIEDTIAMAVENRNRPEFYLNLQHFFYDIVYIVTIVKPNNEKFMKNYPSLLYIDNLIQLNALKTPNLVHHYHLIRARSQKDFFNERNATLTSRCYFNGNDDLTIEILNARHLETILPNHDLKCNPIVKLHLIRLDRNQIVYTTKMHKNTTVLAIDEKYSIKLPPTERDGVIILFTVWSRSLIFKAEEFLGECYIALTDVPGSFVEQQTHLNVTRSSDVTKTVLTILEARRRYDKDAQVFLDSISKRSSVFPKCCMF